MQEGIVKTPFGYELRFWNFITNRIGTLYAPEGFKCVRCHKIIKNKFMKSSHSFEMYHPKCFPKSTLRFVSYDDINLTPKRGEK